MTWTSNASVCARPHVENNSRPLRPFCSSHNTIVELSELLFGENCVQLVFFRVHAGAALVRGVLAPL